MKKLILLGGLLSIFILTASFPAFSQQGKDNNQKDFSEFMDRKGNSYRTASGKPGEAYWQNAADYPAHINRGLCHWSLLWQSWDVVRTGLNRSTTVWQNAQHSHPARAQHNAAAADKHD